MGCAVVYTEGGQKRVRNCLLVVRRASEVEGTKQCVCVLGGLQGNLGGTPLPSTTIEERGVGLIAE